MKISPVNSYQKIAFSGKEDKDNKEAKQVAEVAGGATAATLAQRVSNLNKKVTNIAKLEQQFQQESRGFADGIVSGLKKLAIKLKLDKLKIFKPMVDIIEESPTLRKMSGVLGKGFAFATGIVGVAETVNTYGGVIKNNNK